MTTPKQNDLLNEARMISYKVTALAKCLVAAGEDDTADVGYADLNGGDIESLALTMLEKSNQVTQLCDSDQAVTKIGQECCILAGQIATLSALVADCTGPRPAADVAIIIIELAAKEREIFQQLLDLSIKLAA